jgi:hypothetical protein
MFHDILFNEFIIKYKFMSVLCLCKKWHENYNEGVVLNPINI